MSPTNTFYTFVKAAAVIGFFGVTVPAAIAAMRCSQQKISEEAINSCTTKVIEISGAVLVGGGVGLAVLTGAYFLSQHCFKLQKTSTYKAISPA